MTLSYHKVSQHGFEACIDAAERELARIIAEIENLKEGLQRCAIRRRSQWNICLGLIIRSKFYTRYELDNQFFYFWPLLDQWQIDIMLLKTFVEGLWRSYPCRRRRKIGSLWFRVCVLQQLARFEIWNLEQIQKKGKRVVERREAKEKKAEELG